MTDASGRLSGAAAAVTALAALTLTGCGSATSATPPGPLPGPRGQLVLEFDEGLAGDGNRVRTVQSSGTANLRTKVRGADKGRLERVEGRSGYAVRTPEFVSSGPGPAAVITVKSVGSDELSPGDSPVRWGADVLLDAGVGSTKWDNGANVLQRGLFDSAQLKLQLDGDVPSCRALGADGDALVSSREELEPGTWYRLHCQLRNDRLTLSVGAPGEPGTRSWTVDAEVGTMSFDPSTPVAIGGKVDRKGRISGPSTDQLNGLLDNVFLDVS